MQINSVPSNSYPAPLNQVTDAPGARESSGEASGATNDPYEYELPLERRFTLRSMVNQYVQGRRRTFDLCYQAIGEDTFVTICRRERAERQQALTRDADNFFRSLPDDVKTGSRRQIGIVVDTGQIRTADLDQRFIKLVGDSAGLVLGESNRELGARKLLIENMGDLKRQGVTQIYMEFLTTDAHDWDLKQFYESSHNGMSNILNEYLQWLGDQKVGVSRYAPEVWNKYSYLAVVEAAHREGIQIVPLDCAATCFSQDMSAKTKNYYSHLHMTEALQSQSSPVPNPDSGKWIVLTNHKRTNTFDDAPGLAELLGVPGIRVQDAKVSRIAPDPGLQISGHYYSDPDRTLKSDILMDVRIPVFPSARKPLMESLRPLST